jgi:hypothetical protein
MTNTSLSKWEQDNIKILTSRQMGAWLGRRDNRLLDEISAEIENTEIVYDKCPNYEDDRTDEEKAADLFDMYKCVILQIIDKYKVEKEDTL